MCSHGAGDTDKRCNAENISALIPGNSNDKIIDEATCADNLPDADDPTLPPTYCSVQGVTVDGNHTYDFDCQLFTPPNTAKISVRCGLL